MALLRELVQMIEQIFQFAHLGVDQLLERVRAVADRVAELGAGIRVQKETAKAIRRAVSALLADDSYRKKAEYVGNDMKECGGEKAAAAWIENVCNRKIKKFEKS